VEEFEGIFAGLALVKHVARHHHSIRVEVSHKVEHLVQDIFLIAAQRPSEKATS
jgi:hypothetical protein